MNEGRKKKKETSDEDTAETDEPSESHSAEIVGEIEAETTTESEIEQTPVEDEPEDEPVTDEPVVEEEVQPDAAVPDSVEDAKVAEAEAPAEPKKVRRVVKKKVG